MSTGFEQHGVSRDVEGYRTARAMGADDGSARIPDTRNVRERSDRDYRHGTSPWAGVLGDRGPQQVLEQSSQRRRIDRQRIDGAFDACRAFGTERRYREIAVKVTSPACCPLTDTVTRCSACASRLLVPCSSTVSDTFAAVWSTC